MRLKCFCEQDRAEWILAGVRMVKLTGSKHLNNNLVPDVQFVLVEPIISTDDMIGGDMTARITSYEVTRIIRRYAGLCYKIQPTRKTRVKAIKNPAVLQSKEAA